jgi:hypothetical protein
VDAPFILFGLRPNATLGCCQVQPGHACQCAGCSSCLPRRCGSLTLLAAAAAVVQPRCRSLRDFGLGKSSIAEGGLGLFTLAGGVVLVALLAWAKGTALRKGRPYQATLEFPLACGITVGTPVSVGQQHGQ